jgi:hypothetical protein
VNDREKLKREISLLGETIEGNAQTLASKTMYLDDREALKRQMAIRIGHNRQLQRRLEAKATSNSSGWATEWTLQLKSETVTELAAILPIPNRYKRHDPPDGSSPQIRVRRGPRQAPVKRYDEE